MENSMNLHQRLLEVRKSVDFLKKDEKSSEGFLYVSSSRALHSVREAMNRTGVILIPSVDNYEVRPHQTSKGGNWYFTILSMTFTWVNSDSPDDKIQCKWIGQGLDSGEKGVGKAVTYAEKYFILKFFNIPTDKDDPDCGSNGNNNDILPKNLKAKDEPTSSDVMDSAIKHGIAKEKTGEFLAWALGEFKPEIPQVQRLKLILRKIDSATKKFIERSLEAVPCPKTSKVSGADPSTFERMPINVCHACSQNVKCGPFKEVTKNGIS